jgi:hypothetical protein
MEAHAGPVEAILDTGPGPSITGGNSLYLQQVGAEYYGQYLAAQFTLDKRYSISEVRGWIGSATPTTGTATAVIYADVSGLPGTTLFAEQFTITASPQPTWYGPDDLKWVLESGTYWAGFEVRTTDSLFGYGIRGDGAYMPHPSVSPAPNAYLKLPQGGWVLDDSIPIGVQILGQRRAGVPEPMTLALLGIAVVVLAWSRRSCADLRLRLRPALVAK